MSEPGNILIVDDNPTNLQVLGDILQADGFKVKLALSGERALRAIEAQLPDLILLDIQMPGMDGYETCRRLKSDASKKDIPVIFISALNETADKLKAFQAGAVDYVTKPFQPEEVMARVRTQMELANTRKALSATNARLLELMDQLVQAEKLKSLGSLAAGIAHELNTPVGNALLTASAIDSMTREFGAAQLAGKPCRGLNEFLSNCHSGIELVVRNLNRSSKLIGSLRDVAVDRAGEQCRRINLHDIVKNVVTTVRSIPHETSYEVVIDIDPALSLESYPGHLEHILNNLIQNSITHGFAGAAGGIITLTAHNAPDGRIALVVADNGKGIAPENLKRVFDPYFTTRLGQGGSGLGLNIVYSLATGILGGSIKVASTPGSGAQFTLTLPLLVPPMVSLLQTTPLPTHA